MEGSPAVNLVRAFACISDADSKDMLSAKEENELRVASAVSCFKSIKGGYQWDEFLKSWRRSKKPDTWENDRPSNPEFLKYIEQELRKSNYADKLTEELFRELEQVEQICHVVTSREEGIFFPVKAFFQFQEGYIALHGSKAPFYISLETLVQTDSTPNCLKKIPDNFLLVKMFLSKRPILWIQFLEKRWGGLIFTRQRYVLVCFSTFSHHKKFSLATKMVLQSSFLQLRKAYLATHSLPREPGSLKGNPVARRAGAEEVSEASEASNDSDKKREMSSEIF